MVPLETETQVNFLLSRGAPTVLVAAVALCGATAAIDKLRQHLSLSLLDSTGPLVSSKIALNP